MASHRRVDAARVSLRDHLLVPAGLDLLKPGATPATRDAVLSLLALVPDPTTPAPEWSSLFVELDKTPVIARTFKERRAVAAKQRINPPPALRKSSFCAAPPAPTVDAGSGGAM